MLDWIKSGGLELPIIIGLFPVLLHVFDKLLEFAHPVGSRMLHEMMKKDTRIVVRECAANKAVFDALEAYFDYRTDIHFVLILYLTSMLSAYLGQIRCSETLTTIQPVALLAIVGIALQILGLLLALANHRIDPARSSAMRYWKTAAFTSFVGVMVMDIFYHHSCDLPH